MTIDRFRTLTATVSLLAAVSVCGSANGGAATVPAALSPKPPPAVSSEAASYNAGLMIGSQLAHDGIVPNLSMDTFIRGLKDAAGGQAVTPEQRDAAVQFMRDARTALVEKNRTAGREFLAHNAKEPGVISMPSGLQYRVLAAGDPSGKSPTPTDEVTVRYRASFADGTEFDRSDTHDRPATFRVNSVFKGWQEAFVAMKPGAKWQLFVPPELGYGANSPAPIPPGALLVYEIELLKVDAPPPLDPAAARAHPAPGAKPGAAPGLQH